MVIFGKKFNICFIQLVFVKLLDFSTLLKARNSDLIRETSTLHNHEITTQNR